MKRITDREPIFYPASVPEGEYSMSSASKVLQEYIPMIESYIRQFESEFPDLLNPLLPTQTRMNPDLDYDIFIDKANEANNQDRLWFFLESHDIKVFLPNPPKVFQGTVSTTIHPLDRTRQVSNMSPTVEPNLDMFHDSNFVKIPPVIQFLLRLYFDNYTNYGLNPDIPDRIRSNMRKQSMQNIERKLAKRIDNIYDMDDSILLKVIIGFLIWEQTCAIEQAQAKEERIQTQKRAAKILADTISKLENHLPQTDAETYFYIHPTLRLSMGLEVL
ncbi:hypothetical protein LRY60_03100 [Candidatus Woesebacteria bacterium]|nr:hypothetical protein [Candidatus Woesebacteria bacterium]